ncbi:MAG: DUF3450 domain-containing protein [Pseudomonadota bacterium]
MLTTKMKSSVRVTSFAALLSLIGLSGHAQSVDSVLDVEKQAADEGRRSQARIDRIQDQTQNLLSDYQTVSQSVDDLRIFNAQLQAQINGQVKRIADLEQSIDDIATIRRQVTPEMVEMVNRLEEFVKADIPFKRDVRLKRVDALKGYLEDASITEAERFRQILATYAQEVDYGRSVETYSGTVIHNGEEREGIEFLRLGRVGLFYKAQGANTSTLGMYDKTTGQFISLSQDYLLPITKGIAFADKTANGELLMLPVPAPEGR